MSRRSSAEQTDLCFKARALNERVVELGVGVAHLRLTVSDGNTATETRRRKRDLLAANKELEALGETRRAAMILGERRQHFGLVADKGRADEIGLDQFAKQLVDQPRVGVRRSADDLTRRARGEQRLLCLFGDKVRSGQDTQLLRDNAPPPRRGPWER